MRPASEGMMLGGGLALLILGGIGAWWGLGDLAVAGAVLILAERLSVYFPERR